MFLTHCVMGLTVLTVLSFCLPVWSAVKVIQPYRVVSINGTAQVQCFIEPQPSFHLNQPSNDQRRQYPYPNPEEVRVSLLKGLHGTQKLCSSIPNFQDHGQTGVEKEEEVQCSVTLREGAVEVTVSGLKATDTDVYRCGIEVLYPPPYLRLTGNGTLIHVLDNPHCPLEGPQTAIAHQGGEEEDDEGDERIAPVSIPVVVLVLLVIIVLIIIIYFQSVQCQQGRREIVRSVHGGPYKVDAVAFSCDDMA
ncbi:cytotoxic T-lymphocyte protein 4 [Seriola aureovittata]|uniref:cytotoxic T-lymphocyte protein 4 n=1 Tax=Seriola aureovittata TaxID=2871759 RepID=UPI0024BEC042|nr:cytotoxic T-lymphocyte protein 4 [Seriola aureovittata]